jgi:site-specific DNA recombinase
LGVIFDQAQAVFAANRQERMLGKRHLWQLLRISWLAPDILSAVVEGRQPASLTGRQLLRATSIPLGWDEQRHFFGFT